MLPICFVAFLPSTYIYANCINVHPSTANCEVYREPLSYPVIIAHSMMLHTWHGLPFKPSQSNMARNDITGPMGWISAPELLFGSHIFKQGWSKAAHIG